MKSIGTIRRVRHEISRSCAVIRWSGALLAAAAVASAAYAADAARSEAPLVARIVAVGLPGAGAVSAVGVFHSGGPIHDKPQFAVLTEAGRILDPSRVLVTSASNFGLPLARTADPAGSVLSLAPDGELMVIPRDLAATGGRAVDGRVQLLTAQSAGFLNGVNTPGAVTAELPPVSNPLGISINNGFGRLWFASAPQGSLGPGTLSIVDPGGQPLAGAPSRRSGGVFAGTLTGRQPGQLIPGGLQTGAVATALLGMSPDGSKRAVFAVLTADGALSQAHTERSVDGLAPAGTAGDFAELARRETVPGQPMTLRAGMAFNWVPDRVLYVTDPAHNALIALTLADDGQVFRVTQTRTIGVAGFDRPVDVAPAVPEVANPLLASNTTLAGGSDLYIANRGNGTLLRLRQDGTVLAVRQVAVDGTILDAGRLNGIAVSPDAQRLWVTVSGVLPGHEDAPGALLEVPAFGPGRAASLRMQEGGPTDLAALGSQRSLGRTLFQKVFSPVEGLGPLFNGRSCVECHAQPIPGGVAPGGAGIVLRVGRNVGSGGFDPLYGQGGPVARAHSIAGHGLPCSAIPGIPAAANVTSVRSATALFGLGLVDAVPDEVIFVKDSVGGIRGRPNLIRDADGRDRPGRFGWKADTAELEQFVADAFRNELGITSPRAPLDPTALAPGCGVFAGLDDDGTTVRSVAAYIRSLPPLLSDKLPSQAGKAAFVHAGCEACHVPSLPGPGGEAVTLFSDLLLHDMGPTLDDGIVQGTASGAEWRTAPLWGVGSRSRLLHDGRATSLSAAILAHDGEGAAAAQAFRTMTAQQRQHLLAFLESL